MGSLSLSRGLFVAAIVFLSRFGASIAQAEESAADAKPVESGRPRLFLRCPHECHDDYLRQRLNYFDFVRDPQEADWVLFIIAQESGTGGVRFTIRVEPPLAPPLPSFLGRSRPSDGRSLSERTAPLEERTRGVPSASPVVREVVLPPSIPITEQRALLSQAVLAALFLTLAPSEHSRAFQLELPGRDGVVLSKLRDPWNYWVFSPELMVEGEAESRSASTYLEAGFTARRTTEAHRVWLNAAYGHQWRSYVLEDDNTSSGTVSRWEIQGLYARSLGRHWAIGPLMKARRDTYENLEAHIHYAPALEYNFFPYSENATALLSLTYQAGIWVNWYEQITQLGKTRELRPYQALSLVTDLNQPWGSLQVGAQLNSFFDVPEQLRVTGFAGVSVRLLEGLALTLEAEGAWIRDQISLRSDDVTNEEILLGTTQLPSSFGLFFMAGFSYTFGSVHNTIVNPRFGRITLY